MARSACWALAFVCLGLGGAVGGFLAGPLLSLGQGQAPAAAVPKELNSYRDVVKKVLPAVVSIEAKAKPNKAVKQGQPLPRRRAVPEGFDVPEEFRRFLEEGQGDMPNPSPQLGFGSGFIVDPKGVIVTNHHVVAGADELEVTLPDGRKFTTKDFVSDQKTDLAVIRVSTKVDLPYLEFGDSDQMEIGDRVLAVGAPFGLTGSVTAGIISAKGRNGLSMNMYEDFLQTDAAINPGNSGGPLVNLEGKVVGINSAIKTRSGGFQGVGLAIASNLVKNVKDQLLKDGTVHRGYLGVQIKDIVDRDLAGRLGMKDDQHGVLVTQVFDKAPAGKGGVKDGDVVISIAGKPIKDGRELQRVVASLPLGKPVDVGLIRDGKPLTVKVTIDEQPQDFGALRVPAPKAPRSNERAAIKLDAIGVEITDLTPELAEQLGLKDVEGGVVVWSVDRGSIADEGGLRRGMMIVKVDKQAVASASALKESMAKASLDKGVLLQVYSSQGGTSYLVLKSSADAIK
jgi:serine protease Do